MLYEVSGDILKSKAAVIAHGVAPNDPFHSGLALQLRERFPSMYRDFRHYCQTIHAKPGDIWAWAGAGPGGPVRLVALMTQEGDYTHGAKPGPATVVNVNHSLRRLQRWIEVERPSSLALPKLATGVGGLDWKDVSPLITQHLSHAGILVYVYSTYHKGVEAKERQPAGAIRAD
jgi:O-acetyl-ADP-ribose deacetylase (regulator of RNase III)